MLLDVTCISEYKPAAQRVLPVWVWKTNLIHSYLTPHTQQPAKYSVGLIYNLYNLCI